MFFVLMLPFAIQGLVMFVDEFYYHHKRGLGRWERWGHPLDTLTMIACFSVLVFAPVTPFFVGLYAALGLFSCLFVTKDEFVHAKECVAGEQWLHALLFVLHPVILLSGALCWMLADPINEMGASWLRMFGATAPQGLKSVLAGQFVLMCVFGFYQAVYWNVYADKFQRNSGR